MSKTPPLPSSSRIDALQGGAYAVVDVETTGTSATYGQIIEIGILRIEDGVVVDTYNTLVRPSRGLNPVISSLTGITDADLSKAPLFEHVAPRVRELLEGAIFVAHNARFDYSFVKSEFRRLGIAWNAKTLCTVKLSRKLFPSARGHNLDALIERHKLPMESRHRAFDDAYALVAFIEAATKVRGADLVAGAIEDALGSHTLPAALDPALLAGLPHAPGVYVFYAEDGTVLYVGKSVDIKARVRSHFSSDHLSGKERSMCAETARVEHEETSGELSALLRESALVKELMPVYNRKLRKAKKLAVLAREADERGFHRVAAGYQDELEPEDLSRIQGVFRTASQAKAALAAAAKEHRLCPKLLGLEKGAGPCFAYQLGRCLGACAGKERADAYNARVAAAFEGSRLRSWPFAGLIVLPEDPAAEEGTAYVIDQWRIEKVISYTADGASEEEAEGAFDLDSYKILVKHLLRPDVRRKLSPYARADGIAAEELLEL
jgi:DNA polymerase-3 subunit epsilon